MLLYEAKQLIENSLDLNFFKKLGEHIGVNWDTSDFTLDSFIKGYQIELEHGLKNKKTNVSNNDPVITAKIALAHLNERPDYYERLAKYVEK